MKGKKRDELVPYEMLTSGFEAVWTGKTLDDSVKLKKVSESEDDMAKAPVEIG